MVNYIFRRSIFKIREMAFGTYEDTKMSGSDVIYMHSSDEEVLCADGVCKKQYTLVTDLTLDESELLSKVKKNARYEIRRAEREEANCKYFSSEELKNHPEEIDLFESIYNKMFSVKGMDSYSFNRNLVIAGIESGNVIITKCIDRNDSELVVYHLYLSDEKNTILVYSASPVWENPDKEKVNAIGRMNKLLHWKDIVYFKTNGYSRLEWGGITDPVNPNGIDKFKMEFGGEIACYVNYILPNSLLGKIYIFLLRRRGMK